MMRCIPAAVLLLLHAVVPQRAAAQTPASEEARVVVESRGWQLVGDLRLPAAEAPHPAVLLLHQAAGDRTVYAALARHLADRGVASLRLDLPGHGERVNLGRFVPGETDSLTQRSMIWGADADVAAAHRCLQAHAGVDARRIAMVMESYDGSNT